MIALLFLINNRDQCRDTTLPHTAELPQLQAFMNDPRFVAFCLYTAPGNRATPNIDPAFRRWAKAVTIPDVHIGTEYGQPSLAYAMRTVLRDALRRASEQTTSFVFLSESCCPLYSPDVAYEVLTTYVTTSWMSRWDPTTHRSGQQCVLSRDDAFAVLERFDDIMQSPEVRGAWAPDELVFLRGCASPRPLYKAEGPVFVDWERPSGSSPYTFEKISRDDLFRLLFSDALFFRKVHSESDIGKYAHLFMRRDIHWWAMTHFDKGSAHHVFNTLHLLRHHHSA